MRISTFEQAHEALRPYYGYSRTPYTLDVMRTLMEYLGNPQENIRVVHVAGTSGKTSTSYYCSALLSASGVSTGLFVSPHVDEINERLQINGALLPEDEYCAVLSEFLTLLESCPVKPSYFELLAAMALWEFARRGLDVAVMEVGLGGLLDATNIVKRSDKVCIITDIGFDHTEILGDTIEAIATQKAGIIQPENQVYMHTQSPEVMTVVQNRADRQNAQLTVAEQVKDMPMTLPIFQQRNLALAITAVSDGLGVELNEQATLEAAKNIVPARLERFNVGDKTIIVDGSHNEQKLTTMVASLRELYGQQPFAVLCGFVEGNQDRWKNGLKVLLNRADHIVFTTFHGEQDMPRSSVKIDEIVKFCENQHFMSYSTVEVPEQAFQTLFNRSEKLLVVTGSFYLLNHIRPHIMEVS